MGDGNKTGAPLAGVLGKFLLVYRNLFELICLNVFFVICCVPVVTIPMAVSALAQTMMALHREQDTHLLRRYWSLFLHPVLGQYFTVLPLLLLEAFLGFGLFIYIGARNAAPIVWVGCGMNVVAFGLSVAAGMYLVPWMVSSGEKYWAAWKHAFLLAVAKLPYTVTALAAMALIWIICLRWFQQCWIAFFLVVFSLSSYIGTACADRRVVELLGDETD